MGPVHREPPSRRAPVVAVNGQVLALGLRRDGHASPQISLRLGEGEAVPTGLVVLQVATTEGPLLLEARARADRLPGVVRCELMPIDPAIREWLEGQIQ